MDHGPPLQIAHCLPCPSIIDLDSGFRSQSQINFSMQFFLKTYFKIVFKNKILFNENILHVYDKFIINYNKYPCLINPFS